MPRLRYFWAAGIVVAVLVAVTALMPRRAATSSSPRIVVVEMRASRGGLAQMFWASDLAFTPAQVSDARLAGSGSIERLRFPIPARGVRWLRFDPIDAPGDVLIERVQIVDAKGGSSTIPLQRIRPGAQIARLTFEADRLRVTSTDGASDPSVLLAMGCHDGDSVGAAGATVGPAWLFLISIAAAALIGAAVWGIGQGVAGPLGWADRAPLVQCAWWLGALVVVVFAGKLVLMRAVPVTTPFWDQWDAEAGLFVSFSECRLTWADMFALHNEHRVFFTRLLALDLLALNGQWDPRLEQVVNAAMHTLTATLVALMFWLAAGRRRVDFAVILAALIFALPFSWENSLFGFQSAFYFLLLFSVVALWLTTSHPTGSGAWFVGWACAACALFTSASGLLGAVTIGATWALRAAGDRVTRRDALINIAIASIIVSTGYTLSSAPLAHHEIYRAKSAADFVTALSRSLAWPWIDEPALALVAWLPLAATVGWAARRRFETTALERFSAGLGLWVGLNAAALAYARGAGGAPPAGRYMDFLSLGFIANAMALTAVQDRLPLRPAVRRSVTVMVSIWMVAGLVGLNGLATRSVGEIGARRALHQAHTVNVRHFMLTGDSSALEVKAPLYELPYPDPQRLLSVLQDPAVRRVLPAAIREPLHIAPTTTSENVFVPDGLYSVARKDPLVPAWGSYSSQGNAGQGRFESDPIASCVLGGAVRFDVAGHLGFDDHVLAVRDVRTGRESPAVRRGPVVDGWSMATAPCPHGPFTIVAVDNSRWSWFAFRPPVEIGNASIWAERLIDTGWPLLVAGLILLGLAARWR